MTQITGLTNKFVDSQMVTDLKDKQNYRVGKDGTIKKAGGLGSFLKGAFCPKTLQKQNQKALDTLVRQLKEQYGAEYTKPGKALELPKEVRDGKRAITGKDLREIAKNVQMKSTQKAGMNAAELRTGLEALLKKENPPLKDVLGLLTTRLPKNLTPLDREHAIYTSMNLLSKPELTKLQGLLYSQQGFDVENLLGSFLIGGETKEDAPHAAFINGLNGRRDSLKEALAMTKNSLKLWGAARECPPPPTVPAKLAAWPTANQELRQVMKDLGFPELKTIVDTLMPEFLKSQRKDSVFRGNTLMEAFLRHEAGDKLSPHLRPVIDGMKEALRARHSELKAEWEREQAQLPADARNPNPGISNLAKFALAKPQRAENWINTMIAKLKESPAAMKSLEESVAVLNTFVKPGFADKGADFRAMMTSAFNGIAWIGALGPLASEAAASTIPDEKTYGFGASVIMQAVVGGAHTAEGSPFRKFLEEIPGWKEMMTLPKTE